MTDQKAPPTPRLEPRSVCLHPTKRANNCFLKWDYVLIPFSEAATFYRKIKVRFLNLPKTQRKSVSVPWFVRTEVKTDVRFVLAPTPVTEEQTVQRRLTICGSPPQHRCFGPKQKQVLSSLNNRVHNKSHAVINSREQEWYHLWGETGQTVSLWGVKLWKCPEREKTLSSVTENPPTWAEVRLWTNNTGDEHRVSSNRHRCSWAPWVFRLNSTTQHKTWGQGSVRSEGGQQSVDIKRKKLQETLTALSSDHHTWLSSSDGNTCWLMLSSAYMLNFACALISACRVCVCVCDRAAWATCSCSTVASVRSGPARILSSWHLSSCQLVLHWRAALTAAAPTQGQSAERASSGVKVKHTGKTSVCSRYFRYQEAWTETTTNHMCVFLSAAKTKRCP